jgi:hypothetical protein
MGRKSNAKDHISSPPEINLPNIDLYRKRLRSWKQTSTSLKSNHASLSPSINDDSVKPFSKSTIYTYPINRNNNRPTNLSNTVLSESLTTESAFYCPSISYTSIPTAANWNNNHVTTLNIKEKKRKNSTSSCESLSSQFSQNQPLEMLPNPNDEKNINMKQSSTTNLQLTCRFIFERIKSYFRYLQIIKVQQNDHVCLLTNPSSHIIVA